jgi:hypothetical protein
MQAGEQAAEEAARFAVPMHSKPAVLGSMRALKVTLPSADDEGDTIAIAGGGGGGGGGGGCDDGMIDFNSGRAKHHCELQQQRQQQPFLPDQTAQDGAFDATLQDTLQPPTLHRGNRTNHLTGDAIASCCVVRLLWSSVALKYSRVCDTW